MAASIVTSAPRGSRSWVLRAISTSCAASILGPGKQVTCGWQAERGLAVSALTGITNAHAQSAAPEVIALAQTIGLAELRFSQLFLAANHETAASSNDDIAKPYMEDTRR